MSKELMDRGEKNWEIKLKQEFLHFYPSIGIYNTIMNWVCIKILNRFFVCSFLFTRFSNVIRAHNRLESRYSNSSGGSYDDDKSMSWYLVNINFCEWCYSLILARHDLESVFEPSISIENIKYLLWTHLNLSVSWM